MTDRNARFTGSVPAAYDRFLLIRESLAWLDKYQPLSH